jgi:hypothetical protein
VVVLAVVVEEPNADERLAVVVLAVVVVVPEDDGAVRELGDQRPLVQAVDESEHRACARELGGDRSVVVTDGQHGRLDVEGEQAIHRSCSCGHIRHQASGIYILKVRRCRALEARDTANFGGEACTGGARSSRAAAALTGLEPEGRRVLDVLAAASIQAASGLHGLRCAHPVAVAVVRDLRVLTNTQWDVSSQQSRVVLVGRSALLR